MRRLIAACRRRRRGRLAVAGPAAADPAWAPAATAPIHPGVQTDTNGGQCTANFVFFDASNNVYIGQAAHCSGTDGNTATNGCEAGSLPHGTPVNVDGGTPAGHDRLLVVGRRCRPRRDRRRTPASTTTSR